MQILSKALCLLAFAGSAGATTAGESAKVWLKRHPAVQQDELSDLKDENPDAYAIVKALLTKRSLGLLDPKHPTASFSAAAAPKQEEDAPSGAAAFAKFVTPAELAAVGKGKEADGSSVSEDGEVAAPVESHHHGDWLNWKPASSATDDDAMVNDVLGSVSQLTGSTPKKSLLSSSSTSAFAADEASFAPDMAAVAAPAAPAVAAPVAVAAPAVEANPYLVDFGNTPAKPEEPKKTAMAATGKDVNYLASFSWGDDEASTKPTAAPKQRLLQKRQTQTQAAAPAAPSAFMNWLGGSSKAAAQPAPAAAAAPQEANPYTAGLW